MIISDKHRFIFIHNPKTAGSSVAVSLGRYLGSYDVFIGAIRDAINENIDVPPLRFHRAVGFSGEAILSYVHKRVRYKSNAVAINDIVKKRFSKLSLGAHSTWWEIREYVGVDRWNSYYKFSTERCPFDKLVSFYKWNQRRTTGSGDVTFSEYLDNFYRKKNAFTGMPLKYRSCWDHYACGQDIVVDKVMQWSSLADDLGLVADEIGLDWDGWLPGAKSGFRSSSERNLKAYYGDSENVEKVCEMFHREIEHFGYSLP